MPFAILCAKGARARVTALLLGSVAAYLLANAGLVALTEAESGSTVEMLSIPLQQIARTLQADPEALDDQDRELLETLYLGEMPSTYYYPPLADPVKWAIDYDALEENLPGLMSLWARLGRGHAVSYAEAFLIQNLPYYLPGADALYNVDLRQETIDIYPMEFHSFLPKWQETLDRYDQTLTLWNLPGIRLLSDTAFTVWLAMAGVFLALYRRQRQWIAPFGLMLATWVTCLLGPIALMRYMLCAFYAVPVLLAAMLGPQEAAAKDAARP